MTFKKTVHIVCLTILAASTSNAWALPLNIYWTDTGTGKIQRSDLDGSNVTDMIIGLSSPTNIAVDATGGRIYWTDTSDNTIMSARLDGTGIDTIFAARPDWDPSDSEPWNPRGIALDTAAGKMYWTDTTYDTIQRSDLNGDNAESLVAVPGNPGGIALDSSAGGLYWTDNFADVIHRADLDGNNIESLVTLNPASPGGVWIPRAPALHTPIGMMYWADSRSNTIQKATVDGNSAAVLITSGPNYGVAPIDARGIALDTEADRIYWTDTGNDSIHCSGLDGNYVSSPITTGLSSPSGIALAPGIGTQITAPTKDLLNGLPLETATTGPGGDGKIGGLYGIWLTGEGVGGDPDYRWSISGGPEGLGDTLIVKLQDSNSDGVLDDYFLSFARLAELGAQDRAATTAYTLRLEALNIAGDPIAGSESEILLLVPEPATMSLLALGGLALIRKRKQTR